MTVNTAVEIHNRNLIQTKPKATSNHLNGRLCRAIPMSSNHSRIAIVAANAPRAFKKKRSGCRLLKIAFFRIFFFGILISVGDVASDFLQGYSLIISDLRSQSSSSTTWCYGLLTIAINWLPGLVAAMHIIAMHRHEYSTMKILWIAATALVFYPVLPLFIYIRLLWKNQDTTSLSRAKMMNTNKSKQRQRLVLDDPKLVRLVAGITGGIEAPAQFILQVWLILTGVISNPFNDENGTVIIDLYGNTLTIPTISAFSILFSTLNILKTILTLNVLSFHIKNINKWTSLKKFVATSMEYLPYFLSTTIFRLTALILGATYLNVWTFLPLGFFWFSVLLFGYARLPSNEIPLWLMSFVSIFMPVCCASCTEIKRKHRKKMIELQHATFWFQSVVSVAIFIPTLMSVGILVNFFPCFRYNPNIILGNAELNIILSTAIVMGILSLLFARNPRWLKDTICSRCNQPKILKCRDQNVNIQRIQISYRNENKTQYNGRGKSLAKSSEETFDSARKVFQHQDNARKKYDLVEIKFERQRFCSNVKSNFLALKNKMISWLTLKTKIKYYNKLSKPLPEKNISRIIVGLLGVVIILIPMVIARLLISWRGNENAYIFYRNLNQTKIIRSIVISGRNRSWNNKIQGNVKLVGKLRLQFRNNKKRASAKSNNKRDIIILRRTEWIHVKAKMLSNYDKNFADRKYAGVIIVDQKSKCDHNRENYDNSNYFRPSYPIFDITPPENFSIPMVLIQDVDAIPFLQFIFHQQKYVDVNSALFGITKTKEIIPSPKFICDTDANKKCIPADNILGGNKDIIGEQYRTVSCLWGNVSCPEFQNEQQKQDICKDSNIRDTFCRTKYTSSWEPWPNHLKIRDQNTNNIRHIYAKFDRRDEDKCFTTQNIRTCDNGMWSRCVYVDKNQQQKRYCHVENVCILEERLSISSNQC